MQLHIALLFLGMISSIFCSISRFFFYLYKLIARECYRIYVINETCLHIYRVGSRIQRHCFLYPNHKAKNVQKPSPISNLWENSFTPSLQNQITLCLVRNGWPTMIILTIGRDMCGKESLVKLNSRVRIVN